MKNDEQPLQQGRQQPPYQRGMYSQPAPPGGQPAPYHPNSQIPPYNQAPVPPMQPMNGSGVGPPPAYNPASAPPLQPMNGSNVGPGPAYNQASVPPVQPMNGSNVGPAQGYNPSSMVPPFDPMNASGVADPYYPDLTMDMGNSLSYGQSIQFHAISMPQPTESMPRLRRERLQHLRQERMHRQLRREVKPTSALAPGAAVAIPDIGLPPAAEPPKQDTMAIQRVKVARASSLLSGAFLLSSILGLLQTFLFTYIFGRSNAGEAYLQAYLIPNLIFTVIAGGALSSAFIPVFTSYVEKKDEKTAWHVASSSLNLSVLGMIAFSIVAFFLAPLIVPLYSRPDEVDLIVTLTRIMLIQAIVLGSGVIVGAILNTKQDFTRTALGTVLYNVGLNLGLVPGFLMTFHTTGSSSNTAVYAATWGVVLGAILQVGVQVPGLFKVKMQYTFAFDWRHPGVVKIARQMVPRVLNALMLSLSTAVDRSLLSLLSSGLINAYIQSFSILILPVSLFGSSVSTAAFPTLAGYAAKGRMERVRGIIMETLRGILFLTVPSGVGLIMLSFPIAQALLEHGNFDLLAAQYASIVLLFFAVGLPGLAAVEILTRSFYALQDSKTPVTISVAQFILKIALSVVLIDLAVFGVQWGMAALALSTSIAGTLEAIVLFMLLSRRIGGFDLIPLRGFFGRILLASGVMALVLFVIRFAMDIAIDTTSMQKLFFTGIMMAVVKLLVELAFGTGAFLVTARLLKMEEMNTGLVRRVINLLHIPWL